MDSQRVEQIFIRYIKQNLSPTYSERNNISDKYKELQSYLDNRTFQNGSYARFTSTTPVNDLDVIYILPDDVLRKMAEAKINPEELDINNIIKTLADSLREEYHGNATIKEQLHSVGIFFGSEDDFSIDVVPAIPIENNMYKIPESAHLSINNRRMLYKSSPNMNWIKSDPKGYIEQAKAVDKSSEGRFRKAVKLVKKWKIGCKDMNTAFPLKSFHLELLITELFNDNPSMLCFDSIRKFYSDLLDNISSPRLRDRADLNRFIDSYLKDLSGNEIKLVIEARESALSIFDQIDNVNTEAEIIEAIESLLKEITPFNNIPDTKTTVAIPAVSRPYAIL